MDLSAHRPGCGEDVAPYALHALTTTEARAFEEHLSDCELCRTDLKTLQPVVHALSESPEQVEPPPELRRNLMAVVEREAAVRRRAASPSRDRPAAERSWSRWLPRPLPAFAAACVVLVAGIAIGIGLTGENGRSLTGDAPPGVKATLQLQDDRGRLVLDGMPSPPEGKVMQVWVVQGENGKPEPTDALFRPNRDGRASVAVPGDMDDITRVLVSEEPEGGSQSPTTTPSVDFKLA